MNNATAFSLRGEINAMNLQDLASLKEYLTNKNKKTSNMVLLKGIYEQIASYKNMANTMCKLAASMEHLKQLIHDDIDGNWIDDSGVSYELTSSIPQSVFRIAVVVPSIAMVRS